MAVTDQGSRTDATGDPVTGGEGADSRVPLAVTGVDDDDRRWVTLREASEAAGVSVSALRKAYREERLPSRNADGPYGMQKLVPLDEVLATMGQHRTPERTGQGGAQAPAAPTLDLELLDGWRRSLAELAERLSDEREGRVRAEERERFGRERLEEERAQRAADRERIAELEARLEEQARAASEAASEAAAERARTVLEQAAAPAATVAPVVPTVAERRPRWWRRP